MSSPTDTLTGTLTAFLPAIAVLALAVVILAAARWLLLSRKSLGAEKRLPRQLAMLGLSFVAVLAIIFVLPMSDTSRGQVLSLLGIVLTGVIALSSTTFVANAMAGLMLRAVNSFRPGDFISIGEQFGRVTERGLFHTEIQTEDRDLATLPNLYLVTNPVRVVHFSGTIISATLSLGYDVSHRRLEELLKEAATQAGLDEPFVQVKELGDYSVVYRVAGFLAEVKHLLTARSNLRRKVLDVLHGAGIEIVSPSFMNQRRLEEDDVMIPHEARPERPARRAEAPPEARIFDKAEEAEARESRREELAALEAERESLKTAADGEDAGQRAGRESRLASVEEQIAALEERLSRDEEAEAAKGRSP